MKLDREQFWDMVEDQAAMPFGICSWKHGTTEKYVLRSKNDDLYMFTVFLHSQEGDQTAWPQQGIQVTVREVLKKEYAPVRN